MESDLKLKDINIEQGFEAETFDKLLRTKAFFDALFESAIIGYFLIDDTGKIVDLNAKLAELFGYSKDELLGKAVEELVPDNIKEQHSKYCASFHLKSETRPMGIGLLLHGRRKNGEIFPAEIGLNSVKFADSSYVFVSVVDITKRKTAENEINRLREEYISILTHDLKSPLASIMGFAELLEEKDQGEISDNKLHYVQIIMNSGKSMLKLINDIVLASRLEAGQMSYNFTNFSLDKLIEELGEQFMPEADKAEIILKFSCPSDTYVFADRDRILQVFHNLISSTIRYTPKGGMISISVNIKGETAEIMLWDNGAGIPDNEQKNLFQKFSQVKGERKGTDLGLFIVKKILEGHGTSINFESKNGKGTSFSFNLPKIKHTQIKGNLLMVYDSSVLAQLTATTLRENQHNIEIATGGMDALKKAETLKPDIILTFNNLPDLDTGEFIYSLKENPQTQDIPIILLTEKKMPELENKVNAVILLPLNFKTLLDKIQDILSGPKKDYDK